MSLFWQEIRKILRPGVLVGIFLLGSIYYYMFPSFYIEHFSNGPSAQKEFNLSVEWVTRYGPTLESEERAELDSRLAEEIAKFNRQLEEFPEAAAADSTPPMVQPAGTAGAAYPVGGGGGLRIAAECGECNGLRHPVFGAGSPGPAGLSLGQLRLGHRNPLVQLDLWAVSGHFDRDGAGFGNRHRRCDSVPVPVQ